MLALDAAVERLRKRATEPRTVMLGLADDLLVIANALSELREEVNAIRYSTTPDMLRAARQVVQP